MNKKTPDRKQIRKFGLAIAIILIVLGVINFFYGERPLFFYTWSAALALVIIAVFVPILVAPLYRVALFVGHVLGWFNTRLLLGLIFYLVVTPISLILKIAGKDLLDRKIDRSDSSYWKFRSSDETTDKENYYRQF
ncbi:MAG TPA: hypothetical protein ENN22_15345 [bacterium]|nr:hypothetical protein [bacterium]